MSFEETISLKSPSKLYDQAMAWLEENGFSVVLNPESTSTSYHDIFMVSTPEPLQGITFPKDFKVKRLLRLEEIEVLQELFESSKLEEELEEFLKPLIYPQANSRASNDFVNHSQQRIAIKSQIEKQYSGSTFDLGISFLPSTCGGEAPIAFIPERDWFDEKLQEVELKDVFTIFPQAEIEMIRLFIGRIAVGRTGHVPVGWDKPINHTSRTMLSIVGNTPGLGKSSIFYALQDALARVGYKTTTFGDLSGRFNMGEIATSMFAYADDVVSSSMKGVLASPIIKTLVTNGNIRVENKGENAYNTPSHTALLFNTNSLSHNLLSYDLDSGIIDRVKFISTYSGAELRRLRSENVGGASKGSPSVYPVDHLGWLCKKYNVSQQALMLWVCRLCADHFWRLIENEPTKFLWNETLDVAKRLRITVDRQLTESFTQFLVMSLALENNKNFSVPELSVKLLSDAMDYLRYFAIDPSMKEKRSLLKLLWDEAGRPEVHPWMAMRKLSIISIDSAYHELQTQKALSLRDLDSALKNTFGALRTRVGTFISHSPTAVIQAWEESRKESQDLAELANLLEVELPTKLITKTDWLYSANYDPTLL